MDPFAFNDSALWPEDTEIDKAVILRRAPAGGTVGAITAKTYKGGQFITAADWQREKRLASEQFPKAIKDFSRQCQYLRNVWQATYEMGDNPPPSMPTTGETRWMMKKVIRDMYEQAFLLGKRAGGNLFAVTPKDAAAIKKTRLDEFKYLEKFMADMASGGGKMDYAKRMDYYVMAAREMFNLGFARADLSKERMITWTLGPTEHCTDCLAAADASPMTADVFWQRFGSKGILPQSGKLECLGYNCRCRLVDNTPQAYNTSNTVSNKPRLILVKGGKK